ncbi:MAG: hypothetical protein QOK31_1818 [Solirubrobacteraceae bacterium]|jgi:hypothetical protein|nr:hypothetical protein [Solirubrobacteraceae bacterium]
MPRAWRLRAGALLFAGALLVHELRYALAPQGEAARGHGYLALLLPVAPAAVLLAGLHLAHSLAAARRGAGEEPSPPPFARLWTLAASLLLGAFLAQEAAEQLITGGGLQNVVTSHGAWLVLPLVVGVGLIVSLLLRGGAAVLARAARRARPLLRPACQPLRPRRLAIRPEPCPLATHLAGRAPPHASW